MIRPAVEGARMPIDVIRGDADFAAQASTTGCGDGGDHPDVEAGASGATDEILIWS